MKTIPARIRGTTIHCRVMVSTSMLKRWQKKLDPLELKQPGELAYDAVQHAFNRSVRLVVADLMKRR